MKALGTAFAIIVWLGCYGAVIAVAIDIWRKPAQRELWNPPPAPLRGRPVRFEEPGAREVP